MFTTLIVLKCLLSLFNKIWDGDLFLEEWNSTSNNIISIPKKKKKKKKKNKKKKKKKKKKKRKSFRLQ